MFIPQTWNCALLPAFTLWSCCMLKDSIYGQRRLVSILTFYIWLFCCFCNLLKYIGWVTKILMISAWWDFYPQVTDFTFILASVLSHTEVRVRVLWYGLLIPNLARMWLGSVTVWQLAGNWSFHNRNVQF